MVDRSKQPIAATDKAEALGTWAGKWRVPDDSPDVDYAK